MSKNTPIQTLANKLATTQSVAVQALPDSACAWLAWELFRRLKRPVLCVSDGPRSLESLYQDLHTFGQADTAKHLLYYPGWEVLPGSGPNWNQDAAGDRMGFLTHCIQLGTPFVGAASVQALLQRTYSPEELEEALIELKPGQEWDMEALSLQLDSMGYDFTVEVLEKGEAAKRGGILDLWPPDQSWPVRLEFFGDELESLRSFDPFNQRSLESLESLRVAPARDTTPDTEDGEPTGPAADLFEFLPEETLILWQNVDDIFAVAESYENTMVESGSGHLILSLDEIEELTEGLTQVRAGTLKTTGRMDLGIRNCEGLPHLAGYEMNPDLLETKRVEFLETVFSRIEGEGLSVSMMFQSDGARDRFLEAYLPKKKQQKQIGIILGPSSEGFEIADPACLYIAETDLYGIRKSVRGKYDPTKKPRKKRKQAGARIEDWTDIQPGELVVHLDHGIGRYYGLVEIVFNGRKQEVLTVEYADNAKLHIPVSQAHLLSRYVGLGHSNPRLHSLGGKRWGKEKESAEAAVRDLASNLLETQAMRETLPGYTYGPDTSWQMEFEATFPFQETVDQEQAILAMKRDMQSKRPMDRLICGDVGFGKTEVAIRGAFKAVMEGKQVAILVPTTILAQQHYQSFCERMASFPVNIDMLSRFRTKKQQSETIKRLRRGEVDIVIGTHRVLSADVSFKDLGLVIIDEEQRFGVAHKERLKDYRQLVDVLTLTATPIPRTLYMSLTGARDMSTIQTAPRERQPVSTIVECWDETLIRHAIIREMNREGQVFFLHNRVRTIEMVKENLMKMVPEARIAVGHGQMNEHVLEDIMNAFVEGKFDVLLCTTIIESGLDIPNANTIIIDRADRFGLSELYQLRGRVGRYKHKAYAYLLLPEKGLVTGDAQRRIRAIQRYTDLGSGFKLAMRDLEIRGAGNLLGSNQSGHITAVGFDLYCQLLERTVRAMNDENLPPIVDVKMKIDFIDLAPGHWKQGNAAVIPFDYIEDEAKRIEMYRKLAGVNCGDDVVHVQSEMKDRFGRFPKPVLRLLKLAQIRAMAAEKLVEEVEVIGGVVRFRRGQSYYQPNLRFPRLEKKTADAKLNEVIRLLSDASFS